MSATTPSAAVLGQASTAGTLATFTNLRLQAHAVLVEASQLPGLSRLQRAQAEAAAGLAGVKLHRIHGQATADDAHALIADLEAIARHVDRLIAEIGSIAAEEFNAAVDEKNFADVLANALSDNATAHLSMIADRTAEDQAEAAHDARHPGTHRAALTREA